jgi:hypothetical protein
MIHLNCQRIVATPKCLKGAIDCVWDGFHDLAGTAAAGRHQGCDRARVRPFER